MTVEDPLTHVALAAGRGDRAALDQFIRATERDVWRTVAFLADLGNPYAAIGVDANGRAGIDWGLYGVPETFIVDRDGIIRYKLVGPIGDETLDTVIRPEIDKVLAPPES